MKSITNNTIAITPDLIFLIKSETNNNLKYIIAKKTVIKLLNILLYPNQKSLTFTSIFLHIKIYRCSTIAFEILISEFE